jgi:hypothetical protein
LPFGETLRFDINMQGRQVPTTWHDWSNGETPAVLFTIFKSSFNGTFAAQPVVAFGLEIEPDNLATFNFTLTTTDGTSQTLSQTATAPMGAKFFGWIGDATSMQITCSGNCDGGGFAIANLVLGGFSGTSYPGSRTTLQTSGLSAMRSRTPAFAPASTTAFRRSPAARWDKRSAHTLSNP